MSLYRQLLLAILISSIMALIGSITSSTLSTRDYLVEQLRVKNQDNASALALTLSMTSDATKIELAMAAQFDSGNYKVVRFTDPADKVILEKIATDEIADVPTWFQNLFPIIIPAGNAKVADGWTQLGSVSLESQSAYAYRSLWSSSIKMALTMTLTALLGMLLGYLIIRRIKKPLDQVVNQANAITKKRFISIPVPNVPELKHLANAMNLTVKRLREMFAEEARRLEIFRREANFDSISGLPNRDSFMTQLKEAIHTEETAFGHFLILRLNDLATLNKAAGRRDLDAAIANIGQDIDRLSRSMQDSLAGRLNGSDFALLVSHEKPLEIANKLMKSVTKNLGKYAKPGKCAAIGMSSYRKNIELPDLLGSIDKAIAEAQKLGKNAVVMQKDPVNPNIPKTMVGWKKLILDAIKNDWMLQLAFPVGTFKKKLIHREGPLRIKPSATAAWIPSGQYYPIAERLNIQGEVDLAAISLAIRHLQQDTKTPGFAVNISEKSMRSKIFLGQLKELLQKHPHEASMLWIEVLEKSVFKYLKDFTQLINFLKPFNVKVGIEHFGRRFDQIDLLHDAGVDYLKVDASFTRDIDKNKGNSSFVKGLVQMAHSIGAIAIAEGVLTPQEMKALQELEFDGLTGPALGEVNAHKEAKIKKAS
jgi:EAL domain-containing protein (putative c-di-GMP-specific phosphodiesterase class I)/GGDEF domain-containing protein